MKVLIISGDEDYAALSFDETNGQKEINDLIDGGKTVEGDGWLAEIREVGEADEKFIEWVRHDVQDYDTSKHTNFYFKKSI